MAVLYTTSSIPISVVVDNEEQRLATSTKLQGGFTGLTGSWHWDKAKPALSISTSSYTTFFSQSQPGGFYGLVFKTNSTEMDFRVEVDGQEILTCHLKNDLKDEFGLEENHSHQSLPPYLCQYGSKHYRFNPPEALIFNSSIKLELKSDKSNRQLEAYLATWKEG